MKNRYLEAGKIVNTHGLKGEVKIEPWADNAEFLLQFKTLYIDNQAISVVSARVHKGCAITQLRDVNDVRGAMRLKGKTVFIDREDVRLPEGSYFIADIIGADVHDEDGNLLGKLEEVMEKPAGNVYLVRGEREILIPDVFVLSTDVDAGVIKVRLLEGL